MDATEIFARVAPAVVRVISLRADETEAFGSGFIVDSSGLIVTNWHVVEGAVELRVQLASNAQFTVPVIAASDPAADLAILRVDGRDLPTATLAGPELAAVGSTVLAIGHPVGLTNTLLEGIVSAHRDGIVGVTVLQTSAGIASGSSGGPVLDIDGRVIGVAQGGMGNSSGNLNFAIPVRHVLEQLAALEDDQGAQTSAAGAAMISQLLDADRIPEAAALFRRLPEAHNSAAWWDLRAAICFALWDHDNERVARERAVALAPTPERWRQFAVACHNSGTKGAEDALATAIELGPDYAPARRSLGWLHLREDRHDAARQALTEALELDPLDAKARVFLARSLEALGDQLGALEECSRALALDASRGDVHRLSAEVQMRAGRTDQALASARLAVEADPKWTYPWTTLARVLSVMEEHTASVEAALHACSLPHASADTFQTLAHCHWEAGDLPAALATFQKVLESRPSLGHAALCLMLARELGDSAAARDCLRLLRRVDPTAADGLSITYKDLVSDLLPTD